MRKHESSHMITVRSKGDAKCITNMKHDLQTCEDSLELERERRDTESGRGSVGVLLYTCPKWPGFLFMFWLQYTYLFGQGKSVKECMSLHACIIGIFIIMVCFSAPAPSAERT